MRSKNIFLFSILSLTVFYTCLHSQTGTIRGKIVDAETGEELIGATIILTGTVKGTITDFDGNYILDNVEEGVHSVTVRYVSYETQVFPKVDVKAGESTLLNAFLSSAKLNIDEVVIQARQRQRTEEALQIIQKKSAIVLDGISSKQITLLGDGDAANALKRVTGISITGGRYVYVRGLSDRYTLTSLNGATIPGLDPNRNTVQMDLFPSSIIENIVVVKTFRPDLPANWAGGYINLVTKDFPDKFTLNANVSLGYNPNASFNNNFLYYEGSKTDWLAYDNGKRGIPELAQGQIVSRFIDDDRLSATTKSFNKQMESDSSFTPTFNKSFSIALGNKKKLFGKDFGFNAGLSYSNKYNYYTNGVHGFWKPKDRQGTTLESENFVTSDTKGSNEVLISSILNGNLKLNSNNMIGLMLMHNRSGDSYGRWERGEKTSDDVGMITESRTLSYVQRSLSAVQLKGKHYIKKNASKLNWISSIVLSKQDEPDLRYFTNHIQNGIYEISPSLYKVPSRLYRYMQQWSFDGKVNYELPLSIGSPKPTLKVGGIFQMQNRNFNVRKFLFAENMNTFHGSVSSYLQDDNMWYYLDGFSNKQGIYVQNSENTEKRDSYIGNQMITGIYSMIDFLLGNFRITTGVRFENTYIYAHNKSELLSDYSEATLNNNDLLPAINIVYKFTDSKQLKLSYGRTLARPTFRELMPFTDGGHGNELPKTGNPSLKRTIIDNVDLRFEYYISPKEKVMVSLFSKFFQNPIERSFKIEAPNGELTWYNVPLAELMGIEVEFKKSLGFISPLKNFLIGGNFAYIKTKVSIGDEFERKQWFVPDHPKTRVMTEQPPYIVNMYLNYENSNIGMVSTVVFNVTGEKLYAVDINGGPDVFEQPYPKLDFNISKSIGSHLSIKISAQNILNSVSKYTQTFYGNQYIFESYTPGNNYTLGISYSIK